MTTATYDIGSERLIEELHTGSHEAFTSVYHALHQRLYFFALRFVSENDAEDVTAESFIELWKRKESLNSFDEISAFLHVAVRNRCYNIIRNQRLRDKKQPELLRLLEMQTEDDHLLEQVRVELVNIIYQQIDQLPERMREVFLLSYREGLKPAEVALRLGISAQTVSNQKVSAIRLLKQALQHSSLLSVLLLLIQLENYR